MQFSSSIFLWTIQNPTNICFNRCTSDWYCEYSLGTDCACRVLTTNPFLTLNSSPIILSFLPSLLLKLTDFGVMHFIDPVEPAVTMHCRAALLLKTSFPWAPWQVVCGTICCFHHAYQDMFQLLHLQPMVRLFSRRRLCLPSSLSLRFTGGNLLLLKTMCIPCVTSQTQPLWVSYSRTLLSQHMIDWHCPGMLRTSKTVFKN